jgi:hypothetical protein
MALKIPHKHSLHASKPELRSQRSAAEATVSRQRLRHYVFQSQSHIATDGQSVSQSVSLGIAPHLGLTTRDLLLFDSYGLAFVGRPL